MDESLETLLQEYADLYNLLQKYTSGTFKNRQTQRTKTNRLKNEIQAKINKQYDKLTDEEKENVRKIMYDRFSVYMP